MLCSHNDCIIQVLCNARIFPQTLRHMRSGPFGSSGLGFVGAVDERREARTARGGLSAAASGRLYVEGSGGAGLTASPSACRHALLLHQLDPAVLGAAVFGVVGRHGRVGAAAESPQPAGRNPVLCRECGERRLGAPP